MREKGAHLCANEPDNSEILQCLTLTDTVNLFYHNEGGQRFKRQINPNFSNDEKKHSNASKGRDFYITSVVARMSRVSSVASMVKGSHVLRKPPMLTNFPLKSILNVSPTMFHFVLPSYSMRSSAVAT